MKPCTICGNPSVARGLCSAHYQRLHFKGDPMAHIPIHRRDPNRHLVEDACAQANISYRQFDYWVHCGYFVPQSGAAHPGSGGSRNLSDADVAVLTTMGALAAIGVKPEIAGRLARGETVTRSGVRLRLFSDRLEVQLAAADG